MEEQFEIFDESGNGLGIDFRSVVHQRGFWHRASNILLFLPDGNLLIQRRQMTKDVCPGVWDLSAAEHLKPGETFLEGAIRGLREELGIKHATLEPIGEVTKVRFEIPEFGVKDYEFQQTYRTSYAGPIDIDTNEVAEIRSINLEELEVKMLNEPEAFTPWFRRCVADLELFNSEMI